MQILTKISGKSKDYLPLLDMINQGVQVKADSVEKHLANEKLVTFLEQDIERTGLEKILLHYKQNKEKKIPFLPVDKLISEDEIDDIMLVLKEVLSSGRFTSGPYIPTFEKAIAEYLGKKYVIATSSGTDALMISLISAGVHPGDEVILPANSFAATENAVLAIGAVPVYADIDPETYCLSPSEIEKHITDKTVCILPVHLYGKQADMKAISAIAKQHGLKIIEDGCQAIGSSGLGAYGDGLVLSFNPYKNLGVCGKAGAIATNDEALAEKCMEISYHGFEAGKKNVKRSDYGFNSKIDNLQAAIGLERMKYLGLQNFKRFYLAKRYIDQLQTLEDEGYMKLPTLTDDHVWHLFPIRVLKGERDELAAKLLEMGIETDVYYPVLSHQHQTNLVSQKYRQTTLPHTEKAAQQLLHLPLYPGMPLQDQEKVIEGVHHVIKSSVQ